MALLRYNGGKAKLVKKIISHISLPNTDDTVYLEPFVGGASVALAVAAKYPKARIVINDKEEEIANFWHQIVNAPKDQFFQLYERVLTCQPTIEQFKKFKATEPENKIDQAFRTLFFNRTGFSASNGKRPLGGWGQNEDGAIGDRWNSERLASEMLEARHLLEGRTTVFNEDFEEVMSLAEENWVMYLDPPYYKANLKESNQLYNHRWVDADHVRLCELLKKLPANWVLSYDFHPRIVHLYNHGMTRSYPMPASYSISKRREVEALFVPSGDLAISPKGFVAPQNFEEFYERYPNYVREFVECRMHWNHRRSRKEYTIFTALVEDYTQDLLMFLSALPKVSKYRVMGFTDPIQLFNPGLWGGVTQQKFLLYVKMLLGNKLHTIRTKYNRDACVHADVGIRTIISSKADSIDETNVDFQTYRNFVEKERPNLLPTFDSFFDGERHQIMQYESKRTKLIGLLQGYFIHGNLPKRKEYKKRKENRND